MVPYSLNPRRNSTSKEPLLSEHISEKAHTEGGQKLSLFVSFPKRGDASSNQPLNLTLGRMVLAYSPIGLNGQQVTSGEGHEGKGIISLAFQSHPRVPERATSK